MEPALSTAAALLLAVGFSLHHFMGRKGNEAPGVGKVVNAPFSPATAAAGSGNPQSSVNLIDTDDFEYASFVPLPYADDPSALDEGTVVRVEMPRAALASFGLPVAAMESDGTVRADLIVSADGTPQAEPRRNAWPRRREVTFSLCPWTSATSRRLSPRYER